jgi:hypothetical protein
MTMEKAKKKDDGKAKCVKFAFSQSVIQYSKLPVRRCSGFVVRSSKKHL